MTPTVGEQYVHTMMERQTVIEELRGLFNERGFSGRGLHLRAERDELLWLVQLEKIPRSSRVGMLLGVCPVVLMGDMPPLKANDCPVIVDPSSGGSRLLGHDQADAWAALDMGSAIDDDRRRAILRELADATGKAALRICTVADLRTEFVDGRLSSFARRDARQLLSSTD